VPVDDINCRLPTAVFGKKAGSFAQSRGLLFDRWFSGKKGGKILDGCTQETSEIQVDPYHPLLGWKLEKVVSLIAFKERPPSKDPAGNLVLWKKFVDSTFVLFGQIVDTGGL